MTKVMYPPRFFVLWLNPEPWAIGDVWAGRKDGRIQGRVSPNPNLQAFQNAVREELADEKMIDLDERRITFYFWRQQARYLDMADRKRQRNQADATNLQKGLEDALQGVLFENDREVQDIRSVIVDQGPHVKEPRILIAVEHRVNSPTLELVDKLPDGILQELFVELNPHKKPAVDKWAEQQDDLF